MTNAESGLFCFMNRRVQKYSIEDRNISISLINKTNKGKWIVGVGFIP